MASTQPDIKFLRNTGFALAAAAIMAGALTLFLTVEENRSLMLAHDAEAQIQIVAASN